MGSERVWEWEWNLKFFDSFNMRHGEELLYPPYTRPLRLFWVHARAGIVRSLFPKWVDCRSNFRIGRSFFTFPTVDFGVCPQAWAVRCSFQVSIQQIHFACYCANVISTRLVWVRLPVDLLVQKNFLTEVLSWYKSTWIRQVASFRQLRGGTTVVSSLWQRWCRETDLRSHKSILMTYTLVAWGLVVFRSHTQIHHMHVSVSHNWLGVLRISLYIYVYICSWPQKFSRSGRGSVTRQSWLSHRQPKSAKAKTRTV